MKRITMLAFAVVAAVQLAVPAYSVLRWEDTLANGQVFKLRCEPVDPVHPFQGRYVALNFLTDPVPYEEETRRWPQTVYATLREDAEGFAFVSGVSAEPPSSGPYVRAKALWRKDGLVRLRFPFNRYYMNEYAAPEAEAVLRRVDDVETHVTVRVKAGDAVLEQLYFNGVPAHEFLQHNR